MEAYYHFYDLSIPKVISIELLTSINDNIRHIKKALQVEVNIMCNRLDQFHM